MANKEGSALGGLWDENAYRILAAGAFSLLATGTVVYRILEDWSWVDAFYPPSR